MQCHQLLRLTLLPSIAQHTDQKLLRACRACHHGCSSTVRETLEPGLLSGVSQVKGLDPGNARLEWQPAWRLHPGTSKP